ncbi:MAG: TPM domain-containing protein [Selenomonas sp.]|nr:TPM domain-containing protein [Selenomonas sp.]
MKKILTALQGACLLVLLLCQSLAMAAAPVSDQAGLLSDSQREALAAKIKQVETAHKVKIGICTLQNLPQGVPVGKFANNVLDKNYAGGENGSIVLVIAMGSRDWYISTDNNMRARITDEQGINGLKGLFLEDLSDGKYNTSFNAFVDGVDKYLTYYEQEGNQTPAPRARIRSLYQRCAMLFSFLNLQSPDIDIWQSRHRISLARY